MGWRLRNWGCSMKIRRVFLFKDWAEWHHGHPCSYLGVGPRPPPRKDWVSALLLLQSFLIELLIEGVFNQGQMKIDVVARSVQCGHMITILTGKTPGSTYMAGVVDNISKVVMRHHILGNSSFWVFWRDAKIDGYHIQANMTPKQFFEMGDSEMKVPIKDQYHIDHYTWWRTSWN